MNKMICPNCEKEIEGNIAQCPHCGCHFSVRIEPQPTPIPVPEVERTDEKLPEKEMQMEIHEDPTVQKCPKCGKMIAVNVRFCKWCGSSLSQAQEEPPIVSDNQPVQTVNIEENIPVTKICKSCGRTVNATASFCKWCGCRCNDKKQDEK